MTTVDQPITTSILAGPAGKISQLEQMKSTLYNLGFYFKEGEQINGDQKYSQSKQSTRYQNR